MIMKRIQDNIKIEIGIHKHTISELKLENSSASNLVKIEKYEYAIKLLERILSSGVVTRERKQKIVADHYTTDEAMKKIGGGKAALWKMKKKYPHAYSGKNMWKKSIVDEYKRN